jgi:hypothetical protein
MKCKLLDGEQRHREYPGQFWMPSRKQRTSLRAGDFAKCCFDDKERMWVRITRVCRKDGRVRYHGELDNCPVVVAMQVMDKVSFGPENVIQVMRKKQQALAAARHFRIAGNKESGK